MAVEMGSVKDRISRIAEAIGIALLLIFIAALFRYRFAQPELTETQLFLRIPEALGL